MWSVTLRLLRFPPVLPRFYSMFFSLIPNVTSLVSSKRAHIFLTILAVVCDDKNKQRREWLSPRCGQLRYVFCGF